MNRREFAEALALAALAPMLGAEAFAPRRVSLGAEAGAAATGAAADQPGRLARALGEVIRAQYGERLSEADLAVVIRQIENGLERADKVRKVGLSNGDEPDFLFSALRSESVG